MPSSLTIEDKGWSKLFVSAKELAGLTVECGIFEDSPAYPDGTSVLLVAAVNEYGSPEKNIPARPWKMTTEESPEVLRGLDALTKRVCGRVLDGSLAPAQAAEQLGIFFVGQQKLILEEYPWAPNAASTVARKGANTPLRDTRHLLASISYRVL